jgi:hypothetical protein
VVRASVGSLGNSPNNPTSPFLTSELDMVQHSWFFSMISERRCALRSF